MKIFVSGTLSTLSKLALRRSSVRLSVVCRRILLCRRTPICPALMLVDTFSDGRFEGLDWYRRAVEDLIGGCELFVFLNESPSALGENARIEREVWQARGGGVMIPDDLILDVLRRRK